LPKDSLATFEASLFSRILLVNNHPSSGIANDPFINRHPIFGSHTNVLAYELTYDDVSSRPGGSGSTNLPPPGVFNRISLDHFVGQQPAFIKLTDAELYGGYCEKLPGSHVLFEASESLTPGPKAVNTLASLAKCGFRLGIQDGLFPELESVANVIRIDIRGMSTDRLKQRIQELQGHKETLLADGIENYLDFERAKQVGIALFKGRFFCVPKSPSGKITVNRQAMAHLLVKLQDPEVSMDSLEQIISCDVGLTYKLLRFTNSAFIGLPREVESIGHAARLVGIERIRTWASVLMFSEIDDKPRELAVTALVRAAMCQRLSGALPSRSRETFFAVGLLSLLDALMDCSMESALESLPLADVIRDALLHFQGSPGQALSCAVSYERGEWEHVHFGTLDRAAIRTCYVDSLKWVNDVLTPVNFAARQNPARV
jgi:EAL and modified HD-GYP domain-containing signal transduction protein